MMILSEALGALGFGPFLGEQGAEDHFGQSDGFGVALARTDAAIMCNAQVRVRLPPRVSRTLPDVLPDHTGIGAAPVHRA